MDFTGKTVMITGASVGIGRAAAIEFAKNGADLILLDLDSEKLLGVKNELEKYTKNVMIFRCDVSCEAEVKKTVEEAEKHFGKTDILINNAALWRSFKPFSEIAAEEWKKFIDVNVMGTVYCTQAVIQGMLDRRYGKIINVASVAGVYGNASMTAYSATKGAVISFTRALAKEVADKGISVNAVSPGSVSDSSNTDINAYTESELSFMGRTGTAKENADLICFLASDEASYISGQNIQIDGCRKKQ